MLMSPSDEHLMVGRQGRLAVSEWLEQEGYWVVPFAMHTSAQALIKKIRSELLPSALAGRHKPLWAVVHTKNRTPTYQRYKRAQQGIGADLWNIYLQAQKEVGQLTGHLCILELETPKLYLGKLADIAVGLQSYNGPNMNEPMVYFDVRRFIWYEISKQWEITRLLPPPIPPKVVRPWEKGNRPTDRQPPLF